MEGDDIYITMEIPNTEVSVVYRDKISSWFRDEIMVQDMSLLYNAMLNGDTDVFEKETTRQLRNTISYMDGEEAFYHGFMLGLLMNLSNYVKKSNRETGSYQYGARWGEVH